MCLGGMKCPECEFVYGTKWELNRHLKSKHSLKVVGGVWEVNSIHIKRILQKNVHFMEHNPCHMYKYPGGGGSRGSVCVCGG